jgi:hypothetical protein
MRTILPVIVLAVLSAPAASAQQSSDRKPGKPPAAPLRAAKAAANPCAAYGAGFVRLEGSSTCVKIGGSFGVGIGGSR